ncbi:MAG: hypothetical protein ABJA74_13030 [Lapillicoccus sp.]
MTTAKCPNPAGDPLCGQTVDHAALTGSGRSANSTWAIAAFAAAQVVLAGG